MTRSKPVVVHYHSEWLPPTMTWLHEQIKQLESHCENHVLSERVYNRKHFSLKNIHSFEALPWYRQQLQRFVKKAGITSHLPFFEFVCKTVKADLIHAHFGHMGLAMLPIAQFLNIPLVVTFYGMDIHQLPARSPKIRNGYHKLFSGVSRVLCEGEYMASDIIRLGCPPHKVHVHPLGINLSKVNFQPPQTNGNKPIRILIAGSFREKKGIPLALKAAAVLATSYPVEITIIGGAGEDTSSVIEKQRILEVISSTGIGEQVNMRGFASHNELLNAARDHDIFLSPSIHASDGDCEGGAPVTIIEMAASGLLVVSSTHCDIPGVIKHEQTGYLAEENNLDDLISQLHRAVESRQNWPAITTASREHIETNFDASKQAIRLLDLYMEVLSET